MPRPVQHAKHYAIPGVAFRIHPARADRFAGAMGTVLNKTMRAKSDVFQELLRRGPEGVAVDRAYTWLSDAHPGHYFGFIGPDQEGWLQYGWIPEGQPQYGGE